MISLNTDLLIQFNKKNYLLFIIFHVKQKINHSKKKIIAIP